MAILVVDDSPIVIKIVKSYLNEAGYTEILSADCAFAAFKQLRIDSGEAKDVAPDIDLILLDIILPDMDGRKACRIIKSVVNLKDIPVIMVTSLTEMEDLEQAFNDGAMDYITKPIKQIELIARVRSALRLKQEMDRRKAREQKLLEVTKQLEAAVEVLNRLSSLDGLTGIANRRRFDEYIEEEWKRGIRNAKPVSMIMVDIDFFKTYNDTYGHQAGDECLKAVAQSLQSALNRPGDLLCRYGGEEFAIILPDTNRSGAAALAGTLGERIASMRLSHSGSKVSSFVTISMGVATILPMSEMKPTALITAADSALYEAKHDGRNRFKVAQDIPVK